MDISSGTEPTGFERSSQSAVQLCSCGHRRNLHAYRVGDSSYTPVLPGGSCGYGWDDSKKGCECDAFEAGPELLPTAGCATCGHQKPHTGGGIGVCPCGCDGPWLAEAEDCEECPHLPISHDDDGCTFCGCKVGALVPVPGEPDMAEIEYAIEGGETFFVMVPSGVTVTAVDGVLKLHHQRKPVLGIVRVRI